MAYKDLFFQHLDEMPLPDLGSTEARSDFSFSVQEMNTIHFAVSFTQHALIASPLVKIRTHYGAALEALVNRFRSAHPAMSRSK